MAKKKKKQNITVDENGIVTIEPKKKAPIKTETTVTDTEGNVTVTNTKKKVAPPTRSALDKARYIGKSGVGGVVSTLGGIADAPLQRVQEGAEKGKKKSKLKNYLEGVANATGITTIPKTIKETTDIILDPSKKTGDKIISAGMNALSNNPISQGLEAAGQQLNMFTKNADKKVKKAREKNFLNKASDIIQEEVQEESKNYSKGVNVAANVSGAVGGMIPSIGVSLINPELGLMTTGLGAKGQSTREAEKKGATLSEANDIGLAKGLLEIGTEKLTGGLNYFGKGAADDIVEAGINKIAKGKTSNFLLKKGAEVIGENAEEVISDVVGTAIDKATIDPKAKYTANDLKDTALITTLSTIFLNGIGGGYSKNAYNQNALDVAESKRSENAQKVFESVLEDRIKEATDNGKKEISGKELLKINQEVTEDIQNGQIDISKIESSLGGETYNEYKKVQDKINSLKQEQERLEKLPNNEATLGDSEKLKNIKEEISKIDDTKIKQQLSDEVRELTKDDELLQRSYAEKDNRSKEFTYEGTNKDTDITKATIESTKGKMNNTKKAHNLVDALIKMGNDRGVAYKVTNNEELKKMGLAQDGKTVNGVYVTDNGEILVNLDSKNYLEQILVHETTHTMEKAKAYEELKQLAQDFAKNNGTYDSIMKEIKENYAEKEWDSEVTARILEDNLGNEDFVKELTHQKPKLVQKIIDTIKYLKKQFTAGSSEARKLNKLQYQMEQAYKKAYNEKSDVENKNNLDYNENGDINESNRRNARQNIERGESIEVGKDAFKESGSEISKEVYEKQKQYAKENRKTNNNKFEQEIINEIKNKYKRNVVIFKDNGDNNMPLAFVDNKNPKTIYVSDKISKENRNFILAHENMEALLLENKGYRNKYLIPLFEMMTNDSNFNNIYNYFVEHSNLVSANATDDNKLLVAKDILCDYYAKLKTGEEMGYEEYLNPQIEQIMKENIEELEDSSFSNAKLSVSNETGKLQENGKDVALETSKTGNTGTLMAIHNLSEDKMKGILELGGFPVPSIAITNPSKVKHEGYGNISVLFDKKTIDPAIKENEVYDRDVWSPRFPNIAREIIEEKVDKVANDIGMSESSLQSLAEDYGDLESLVYRVSRDTDVVEKYLNDNNIKYTNEDNLRKLAEENGIVDYLNKELENIYGEKGIYNNKSYITDSGRRRKFWEMHDRYTLDNLVKNLTSQDTVSSETTIFGSSFGNIQANMSNKFKSLEDIKKNESKIKTQEDANKEVQKLVSEFNEESNELSKLYGEKFDPFWDMDSINYQLQEFSKSKNIDADSFYDIANKYNKTLAKADKTLVDKIVNTMNKLKSIPTDYFEAKPQRAVGLDEVQQIVIPNNVDTEFKKQLQEAGLSYAEYDPNIEGDRQRVINQFDDLKFSKSDNDKIPMKRKGTLGSEVKLENAKENTKEIAPIKGEVRYSTSKDENTSKKPTKTSKKARKNYVDEKIEKAIQQQAYKNMNITTKTAQNYLQFTSEQKKAFKDSLIDLTTKTKDELVNADTYNEVKDIVSNYANVEYNYVDEELKSIKKEIRNTKIKVPDEVKSQITDYSNFRKSSRLNINNSGQSIDSVYQELSQEYPYLFSEDIQTEADMLYELSDFMYKDEKTTEKFRIPDSELKVATDKIYNSILNNSLTQADIEAMQKDLDKKAERRTRQVVQNELLNKMGITQEDIATGNDVSSAKIQLLDPKRLNESVFSPEVAKKINDATVNFVSEQEAKSNRWKNKERSEIKDLGIKARSKESAAVQKYGEKEYVNKNGELVKYGDAELEREFSNPKTREKIKNAAKVLREKYDNYIDMINNSLVEMGYDPIPKRKDYFRHFYEINDKLSEWGVPFNRNSMNGDTLPTDINGLTDQFKPGKNYFASAMQRKGVKTVYDAITGIDGYLESAGNLIYQTESIQRYRTLSKFIRENYGAEHGLENVDGLTDAQIQQRIEDIQNNKLSKYVAWLDEQANSIAGKKGAIDRSMERFFGRKVYSALNTLKTQVGSNMTGFNVRSAMTNFASAIQGASKTNKLAFLKGTLSTINNIVHDDGLIDKSNFLTNRLRGSDSLSKKAWQKVANAGQIFMTGTDYFTSNQIWRSKYYENLSKGMSESEAIKNADDFASRIMGDRSKGQTAEIFNSKTLGFLTQFQLEVNNQWNSIIHDNKMDIKTGNKSGAMAVFQLGQLFGLSYMFNNLMKSLTGSDVMFDPIDILKDIFKPDDDDKDLEERTRDALGKVVNQLPMASIFTGGRIPLSEAFKGGSTAFKYATGQSNKYGQKYTKEDVKKDLIESGAYWLLPTGYGQIRKTTKGLKMYDKDLDVKGSYTDSGNLRFTADDTLGEKVKASLFGQYATKHAQDYIDSGYQSINKSKLDELSDLKMNSTEYRKYRQGLSDAGTKKEDKLNYIKNLDVSNKKKNIMASNVMKKDIDMKEYSKFDSLKEYTYAKKNPAKYKTITAITTYDNYNRIMKDINEIKADVDRKGNAVKGSRFKKVAAYVNSLKLSAVQKAMLLKQEFPSYKQYDKQIAEYVNKMGLSFMDKATILKGLGYTSYDKQIINYVQRTYDTVEEQIKALEDMGFKTYEYNGRTYVKR